MTTFDTLFGGLAAVVVLFFLLGFARSLPPLFRALIAGGTPLFAYFVSLFGKSMPGLDVIAIHVSVFVAAAAVLHVLAQFRRKQGRLHWAPRLLIAFFVLLAFINATLMQIATKGLPDSLAQWWLGSKGVVHSGFSGVVEHGEMAAKGESSGLSRRHRQKLLGWKLEAEGLDPRGPAERRVVVRVRDRTSLPVAGLAAKLALVRPGGDAVVAETPLAEIQDGVYAGVVRLPQRGRWYAELNLAQAGKLKFTETRELIAP